MKVYDLKNAGPRHRFTVRGTDKKPFLVSNCTQAVARDVLIEHILAADEAGLQVLWTVHDEIIIEVDEETAERDLKRIEEIMTTPPDWWPDLPLAAEAAIVDKYAK